MESAFSFRCAFSFSSCSASSSPETCGYSMLTLFETYFSMVVLILTFLFCTTSLVSGGAVVSGAAVVGAAVVGAAVVAAAALVTSVVVFFPQEPMTRTAAATAATMPAGTAIFI